MLRQAWSTNKIFKEIEKCEVVCANYHSIRTGKRNNNWRNIEMSPRGKALIL